jgi:hypothetical protein
MTHHYLFAGLVTTTCASLAGKIGPASEGKEVSKGQNSSDATIDNSLGKSGRRTNQSTLNTNVFILGA